MKERRRVEDQVYQEHDANTDDLRYDESGAESDVTTPESAIQRCTRPTSLTLSMKIHTVSGSNQLPSVKHAHR